jgi:hypothetical protein
LETISVDIIDFDVFVALKIFSQLGHENVHTPRGEVIVVIPNLGQGF